MDWMVIETAPKDGRAIRVKRVYERRKIYDGMARFCKMAFPGAQDPITGERYAEPYSLTAWGWEGKLVPRPTHWLPSGS